MRKYCTFIFCIGLCVSAALAFPPVSAAHPMVDASGCLACHDLGEFALEGLHGTHTDCFACHDGPTERGNVHAAACLACHPRPLVNAELCSLVGFHEGSDDYVPSGASCLSAGCHADTCAGFTTTTTTPDSSCPAEEIYGEGSFEVLLLRSVRDTLLRRTPEGQELIKRYYQWSPALIRAMHADETFKQDVKKMIDGVLELIGK
jgi:hypothetical protein